MITGEHIPAIRQYTHFYLRWRVRALAYLMLLADAIRRSATARIRRR